MVFQGHLQGGGCDRFLNLLTEMSVALVDAVGNDDGVDVVVVDVVVVVVVVDVVVVVVVGAR